MRIEQMRKHAEQMHEHLRQDLAATEIEATAGGGMVTVAMNGLKQVLAITIDPEIIPQGRHRVSTGPHRRRRQRRATQGRRAVSEKMGALTNNPPATRRRAMALDARPAAPSTATCSRATSGRC